MRAHCAAGSARGRVLQGDLNFGLITRPMAAAWQWMAPDPDAEIRASAAFDPLAPPQLAQLTQLPGALLPEPPERAAEALEAGTQSAVVSAGSAVFSSIMTSVFDAPVEMFRHRVCVLLPSRCMHARMQLGMVSRCHRVVLLQTIVHAWAGCKPWAGRKGS